MDQKHILVIGGGFGGISTALALEKENIPDIKITLVSNKTHFEYQPALYRVVTGRSPLEVCIPLRDIFDGKNVEVIEDTIIRTNLDEKKLDGSSGSHYSFDFLILALGSETAYFDIPGLKELSFGFKSINNALRLKEHLHEVFTICEEKTSSEECVRAAHIVVIGGGASGVELSGELAVYTREMAKHHGIDPALVTIDLIEAAPRLLPSMPEEMSKKVYDKLHSLGVNIFLNRTVVGEEVEKLFLKDMELKTKTVIWTAGVKPNRFYSKIPGLVLDNKGRVVVDDILQAKGFSKVFVIGDAAATQYSGMAQTAIHGGEEVAKNIASVFKKGATRKHRPIKPYHSIPVGPGWAATIAGPFMLYGSVGWILRRVADLRYFLSVLSVGKAISAFRSKKTLCEVCTTCIPDKTD